MYSAFRFTSVFETCKSGKDVPESLERVDVVSNAWMAALQFAVCRYGVGQGSIY